ncbi:MAG: DUF4830 domain-containing protein [Oscillospiraceae bacterium]
MFVVTLRKGGLKKLAVVAVCGAILVGGAIGVSALIDGKNDKYAEDVVAVTDEAVASADVRSMKIASPQELVAMLGTYGITADAASAQVISVKVPRKWDDSFKAFNEVIKESGLDLSKAKGKKLDKWLLMVPALCIGEEKTYAVVLVNKDKPVGAYLLKKPSGEVLSVKPASVAQPLLPEEKAANADFGEEAVPPEEAAANVPLDPNAPAAAPTDEAMPTE